MASSTVQRDLNHLLDEANMTPEHWKVWFLSAMGVFLDGFDLFIISVALPVIQHDPDWNVTPALVGLLGIAALVGAVVGATVTGRLTDRFGRKTFYIADLGCVIVAVILCALAWDIYSLIVFRFILGIAIGSDYPISASYVSEFMPARIRGRMLIGEFSFQAVGMLCAAAIGLLTLKVLGPDLNVSWRLMLAFAAIPAAIVMILRLGVPESTRWLLAHGENEKAAEILYEFVPTKKDEIQRILQAGSTRLQEKGERALGYAALFSRRYLRRTVLSVGPWFCMDIATYGIGIFTPIILASMIVSGANHSFFHQEWASVEGAAFVDVFLILGFVLNIILIERLGRIRLQIVGFAGMFVGLCLLAGTSFMRGGPSAHLVFVFAGFIIFNLLMNMGPNATTYMLPVELFPTEVRASGHGLSAAAGKAGATVGVLLLPILKANPKIGLPGVLLIVAGIVLVGMLITVFLRIETMGKSLDEIGA